MCAFCCCIVLFSQGFNDPKVDSLYRQLLCWNRLSPFIYFQLEYFTYNLYIYAMLGSQKMFEFRVFTMKYWLILNPFTTVVCVPK